MSRLERHGVDVVGLNEDSREENVILKQQLGITSLVAVDKRETSPGVEDLVGAIEHEEVVDSILASGWDGQHTTEHSTQFELVSTSSRGGQSLRSSFLSNIFRRTSSHQGRDITPTRLQPMRKTQASRPSLRTILNAHQSLSAPDLDLRPQSSLGVPRRRLSKANRTRYIKDRRRGLLITGGPANIPQPEEHPPPSFQTNDDPTMRNTWANAATSTCFIEEGESESEESDAASASSVITYDGGRDLVRRRRRGGE